MKIMFYAHDPGGGNSISPLIKPLRDKGHELFIYAKGPSLNIIKEATEYIEGTMDRIKPDLIITGTSGDDFTERKLWVKSQQMGIQSIVFLDHWLNYGMRFSKYDSKTSSMYDGKYDYLPSYIVVMDEYAKKEMVKDGIPEDIIKPLGNLHFHNTLLEYINAKNIKDKFVNQNEILIIFASQPYSEFYNSGIEYIVIEELIKITESLDDVKILVRTHPREAKNKFDKYRNKKVIVDDRFTSLEVIKASDLVISITSMFIIESMIVGKKVISYQPNETDKNKFILTKNNELKFINNYDDFKREVLFQIGNKDKDIKKLYFENTLESIIDFIEDVLKNVKNV